MKQIILAVMALILVLPCCSSVTPKLIPEYDGIDPKVQKLVDEYLWLSAQNHIHFKHSVTVGFKHIDRGNIIGLTTYAAHFREIDLDINYWNHATYTSKLALLWHELTHAYCERDHDYGKDLKYPETESARIMRALEWTVKGGDRPGYYDDGCPFSLMYPVVLDDECTHSHYNDYIKEMFDRCVAW